MRLKCAWIVAASLAFASGPAHAQSDLVAPMPISMQPVQTINTRPVYAQPTGFDAYKLYLAAKARSEGIREATIQANVLNLSVNRRVMQLDQSQPGGPPNSTYIPPFAPYQRDHVTPSLISRGQSRYSSNYGNLARIQARYGVDPGILMAIYGHETSYGAVTGGFDLLEALASLAYEGRRRAMFEERVRLGSPADRHGRARVAAERQLRGCNGLSAIHALRICGFAPTAMATATPTSGAARRTALLPSPIISATLAGSRVCRGVSRFACRRRSTARPSGPRSSAPRCARVYARHSRWLTVGQWRSIGVVPYGSSLADREVATLLEPDGPSGRPIC